MARSFLNTSRSTARSSTSLRIIPSRPPGLEFAHSFCIYLRFSGLGFSSLLLKHRGFHQGLPKYTGKRSALLILNMRGGARCALDRGRWLYIPGIKVGSFFLAFAKKMAWHTPFLHKHVAPGTSILMEHRTSLSLLALLDLAVRPGPLIMTDITYLASSMGKVRLSSVRDQLMSNYLQSSMHVVLETVPARNSFFRWHFTVSELKSPLKPYLLTGSES